MKNLIIFILFFVGNKVYCQDTLNTLDLLILDSDLLADSKILTIKLSFNYLYHHPDENDEKNYRDYKYLIYEKPNSKNYKLYYSLACSLWELEKINEAEKMFLTIINSKEKFYSDNYYYISDLKNDTNSYIYGYSSYTTNYKNKAAIYLTKIYLEKKRFERALNFIKLADKKYITTYNCGTGFSSQEDLYDFLYSSCYLGLKKYKKVINLLLPECLVRNDTIILSAIRNTYSEKEIQKYLENAEKSIIFKLDSLSSFSYQEIYSDNKLEKSQTNEYISGSATIQLFGQIVTMSAPSLENGQKATKEMFVNSFKESDFYISLKNK